jgi:exonuclease VII large subunit
VQDRQHQAQQQDQQRQQQRLSQQQQQQLIGQQQQRLVQYRRQLEDQQRQVQQQSAQLQQEKRTAQYRFQQQYSERLREQQVRLENQRSYNYSNDPYFYTPPSYRYSREGSYYETNQYGAKSLRQAVNYGYQEGFRAGQADREDRWASNYRDSYAYQDANYGYDGYYVERDDYNYYFREGFRRGYQDGYDSSHQYGSNFNGQRSILGDVLASILNLESLHQ